MPSFTLLSLPTFSDTRGSLSVLDGLLPFAIRRTYWIYGADGQIRGGHRHRETRQALIAVSGTVSVFMSDGLATDTVALDHPGKCLVVEPKDWHTMTFGANAVLLVLASHPYDRTEYIDARYEY